MKIRKEILKKCLERKTYRVVTAKIPERKKTGKSYAWGSDFVPICRGGPVMYLLLACSDSCFFIDIFRGKV